MNLRFAQPHPAGRPAGDPSLLQLNKSQKFIIYISILLEMLIVACAHSPETQDSISHIPGDKNEISATEEELAAVATIRDIDYKNTLRSAYNKCDSSLRRLIDIRNDMRHQWDGAAGENFTFNFHKIIGSSSPRHDGFS